MNLYLPVALEDRKGSWTAARDELRLTEIGGTIHHYATGEGEGKGEGAAEGEGSFSVCWPFETLRTIPDDGRAGVAAIGTLQSSECRHPAVIGI